MQKFIIQVFVCIRTVISVAAGAFLRASAEPPRRFAPAGSQLSRFFRGSRRPPLQSTNFIKRIELHSAHIHYMYFAKERKIIPSPSWRVPIQTIFFTQTTPKAKRFYCSFLRSSTRMIFPDAVFGISSMNSILRGYLYGAVSDLTWS